MKVSWKIIQTVLESRNASKSEVNTFRSIFNHPVFQVSMLRDFGVITEKTFSQYNIAEQASRSVGIISDLASLDTFDLIDFLESHSISFKQAASITPQQMSLLPDDLVQGVTDVLVGASSTEQNPLRFILSSIVQTGFPYKKVKGDQHFERINGGLKVTMSAPNDIGLPSGMYPRLFFVYLCSCYKKTKSRSIDLGPSLKSLVVDEFSRPWSTGKSGTAQAWRRQILSLLGTSFTTVEAFYNEGGKQSGIKLNNVSIAKECILWWDNEYEESLGAHIELSADFAEALDQQAVPVDNRAILKLAEYQSPLAFDLYCWMTYRFWAMEQNSVAKVDIPWKSLYQQLGTSINTVRQFRSDVRKALADVASVYPQANFRSDNVNHLTLVTSEPHISPEHLSYQQPLLADIVE